MSDLLASVSSVLLTPTGLEQGQLAQVFSELAGPGIDAADLYFENRISEAWVLEEGIVKEGSFNLDQGVGVRALAGEKTGFSYSNLITSCRSVAQYCSVRPECNAGRDSGCASKSFISN